MRRPLFFILCMFCASLAFPVIASAQSSPKSTRAERRLVMKGNKLYEEKKFREAAARYQEALKENPGSASAAYNLGLSQLRQVANPMDSTKANMALLDNARRNLTAVAAMAKDKPGLASKANYNLGNLEFKCQRYEDAVRYYKQCLRIDPGDIHARKNLRIAQLQLQNKDKNKDKNQDKNKDKKQDQDKDKDKNQNKDQNKDKEKNTPPRENEISQQSAARILQAVDNKEAQTRARVQKAAKGDRSTQSGSRLRKW